MQHVRALKQFSAAVQHWDDWLVHVVVHKLAYETRRQWELSLTDDGNPKLSDLQSFLEARCRSLQVLQSGQDHKAKRSNSSTKPRKSAAVHTANIAANNQNTQTDNNRNAIATNPQKNNLNKNTTNNINLQNANYSTRRFHCQMCSGDHKIYNCDKFNSLSHELRLDNIRRIGACVNCPNLHTIDKCKSLSLCRICQQKHHSMLHNAFAASTLFASISSPMQDYQSALVNASYHTGQNTKLTKSVLLATALVVVHDINGRKLILRVLLDQDSQSSFVTEACVQKLHLQRRRNDVAITGIGCTNRSTNGETTITLEPLFNDFHFTITALILPRITNLLPATRIQLGLWPHLEGLQLADPENATPAKIDILIGADQIPAILQPGLIIGPEGTPSAQETRFGWVLFGKIETKQNITSLMCLQADTQLTQLVQKAWELESHADKKYLTTKEQLCEELFDKTHQRDEDGRFIVSLPFKPNNELGESRQMAIRFWLSTERRLRKNEQHRIQYHAFMQEMLQQGHLVPVDSLSKQHFYMPHHSVVKETSATTKMRIVFNASFKTSNGKSLNDALMVGPKLQNDLTTVLHRFQMHRYALIADIASMYRQIKVCEPHTDFQRIVWRKSEDEPIQDYQILRVIYGVASSLHHAVRVLQELAKQHEKHHPLSASAIVDDFYMDDLLTGATTEQELKELRKTITYILSKGCFELRKFSSNSLQTLRDIPYDYQEQNLTHLLAEEDDTRALGLRWNSQHDYLHVEFKLQPPPAKCTKRTLLSYSCRLFDPVGKLSPVTLVPKIMFQQVWKLQISWDDDVPNDVSSQWLQHRQDLQTLSRLKMPRWFGTDIKGARTDLHCFADASEMAYATVIYARTLYPDGSAHVHKVSSKSRVTPLRTISIFRLELCATALAADLADQVKRALGSIVKDVYGWTDSKNVLAWLKAHPSKWSVFVANSVAKVQAVIEPDNWKYVPTDHNPADCASRGMRASRLLSHDLWWNGPSWLQQQPEHWPTTQQIYSSVKVDNNCNTTMTPQAVETPVLAGGVSSLHNLHSSCNQNLSANKTNKPTAVVLGGGRVTTEQNQQSRVLHNAGASRGVSLNIGVQASTKVPTATVSNSNRESLAFTSEDAKASKISGASAHQTVTHHDSIEPNKEGVGIIATAENQNQSSLQQFILQNAGGGDIQVCGNDAASSASLHANLYKVAISNDIGSVSLIDEFQNCDHDGAGDIITTADLTSALQQNDPPNIEQFQKNNQNRPKASLGNEEQLKSTYGRLRVFTAPPTTVHDLSTDTNNPNVGFSHEKSGAPYAYDATAGVVVAHKMTIVSASGAATRNQQTLPLTTRRSATSTNLRPSSSGPGSVQRLSSGGGNTRTSASGADHSVTQYALIDDENISALQQVTKGGGGALTLASQWKSQFDDSEDTTDNEWKQEPQSHPNLIDTKDAGNVGISGSPAFLGKSQERHLQSAPENVPVVLVKVNPLNAITTNVTSLPFVASTSPTGDVPDKNTNQKRCNLNIAGIENYTHIQDFLPHCWSEPAMGNMLRRELEPPLLQQAAFDNTVYRMDITRNVCIREVCSEAISSFMAAVSAGANTTTALSSKSQDQLSSKFKHRNSLPNVSLPDMLIEQVNEKVENVLDDKQELSRCCDKNIKNVRGTSTSCKTSKQRNDEYIQYLSSTNHGQTGDEISIEGEGCISGRLEIRVYPQDNFKAEDSMQRDSLVSNARIDPVAPPSSDAKTSKHKTTMNNTLIPVSLKTKDISRAVAPINCTDTDASQKASGTASNDDPSETEAEPHLSKKADSQSFSTTSKIPVLNTNSRLSKCASWAGCDPISAAHINQWQPTTNISNNQDLPVDMSCRGPESIDLSIYGGNKPDKTDLTPALRRRRESADAKYVTDISQLNLRFTPPRSRYTCRSRGIPTRLLGQFEDNSTDNSEEQYVIMQPEEQNSISAQNETNFCIVNKITTTVPVGFQQKNVHPTINNLIAPSKMEEMLEQNKVCEEELLCKTAKDVSSTLDNAIHSGILPPPGAPKLVENSARLRRYRHNID